MTEQLVNAPHEKPDVPPNRRRQGYYVPGTSTPTGYALHKPAPRDAGQPLPKGYKVHRKFEYVDKHGQSYTVPASGELDTDLASIPAFASWLVPKDGRHTQAALVHDAMIVNRAKGEVPDFESSPRDGEVTDLEADAIFRRGMQVSGVPPIRRWMIWCAVAMRTSFLFGNWRQKIVLGVSSLVFGIFGLFALPDVLHFPQYGSLVSTLRLAGVGAALVVASLAWRRWRRLRVALGIGAATVALLWAGIAQLPDHIPAHVPSVLPSFDPPKSASLPRPGVDSNDTEVAAKEAKAREHLLDWYRYTNEDPAWMQAGVFVGILAAGACLTAAFLWPRRILGLSFPVLLGLLAFPLFFVLVATGVYWAVEGPDVARKWWKERNG